MSSDRQSASPLGAELVHPSSFVALGALVINDHLLKLRFPGFVTGKLSDFAGLYVFVIFLFVVFDALAPGSARRTKSIAASVFTIIGFSLVKLVPSFNGWVGTWWGVMQLDASDLVALPMAPLASLVILRQSRTPTATRPWLRFAAFTLTAIACVATSPIRSQRAYPMWKVHSLGARRVGCAVVEIWVSKSGKEGVGASVSMRRAASGDCRVTFVAAELDAGQTVRAAKLPDPTDLDESEKIFYIPFPFDNEASWNRGVREGSLTLTMAVTGAETESIRLRILHERPGPHVVPERPSGPPPVKLPPRSDAGLLMADPDASLTEPTQ